MAARGNSARLALGLAAALLAASAAFCRDVQVLRPLVPKPTGRAAVNVRLRGDHELFLYAPTQGAPLALSVQAGQVGRYKTEIVVDVPGVPGARRVLRPQAAGGPTSAELSFRAPRAGVVAVNLSTSANAAVVAAAGACPWLALEASQARPLHVISRAERLEFFVPPGTRRFAVFGRGGGRENVRLSVFDPDGRLARQVSAPGDRTAVAAVDVPAGQQGKVWWLKADRPPELDMTCRPTSRPSVAASWCPSSTASPSRPC